MFSRFRKPSIATLRERDRPVAYQGSPEPDVLVVYYLGNIPCLAYQLGDGEADTQRMEVSCLSQVLTSNNPN